MSVGAPQPEDEFLRIMTDFMASEQTRVETAMRELRDVLFPQLRQYGVAHIHAAYSGYGDAGAIDGVQYRDATGLRVDRETIPTAIHEALDACLYEFLPAGFAINDGSQGSMMIDLSAGVLTIHHGENEVLIRETSRQHFLK